MGEIPIAFICYMRCLSNLFADFRPPICSIERQAATSGQPPILFCQTGHPFHGKEQAVLHQAKSFLAVSSQNEVQGERPTLLLCQWEA